MTLSRENALARGARGLDRWLGAAVGLAAALLAAAWFLPLMTVSRFWVVADEFSIAESLVVLLGEGEIGLFLVIFVFTMAFPVVKLGLAAAIWYRLDLSHARARRWLGLVDTFGKWSMLDVFVVALTVVAINISLVSDVAVHLGLYLFIASVVLSMLAVARITTLAHRRMEGEG